MTQDKSECDSCISLLHYEYNEEKKSHCLPRCSIEFRDGNKVEHPCADYRCWRQKELKMSWRPPDWEEIIKETIGDRGIVAPTIQDLIEVGADAMHKADVDYLREYLIERPATGKVRIIMDIVDWQKFEEVTNEKRRCITDTKRER